MKDGTDFDLERLKRQTGVGKPGKPQVSYHPKFRRPKFWDYAKLGNVGKTKVGNGYYRRQLRKIRKVI